MILLCSFGSGLLSSVSHGADVSRCCSRFLIVSVQILSLLSWWVLLQPCSSVCKFVRSYVWCTGMPVNTETWADWERRPENLCS